MGANQPDLISFDELAKILSRLPVASHPAIRQTQEEIPVAETFGTGEPKLFDGLFPLGWRRGEPVEVELFGGNLKAPLRVKPALGSAGFALLHVPGEAGALPFPFLVAKRPKCSSQWAASPPAR